MAPRELLHKTIRLEYEKHRLKVYKIIDKRHEEAFLKKLQRELARAFSESAGEAKSLSERQRIVGSARPEPHVMDVSRGLLALCGGAKYRAEGKLYPDPEFMEPALHHIRTGYPGIYECAVEMGKWRPACLKPGVEKADKCMRRYGQARDTFAKKVKLLADRLGSGVDKLETSWCRTCESMDDKAISNLEEEKITKLLRIVWDVAV